jgi:hypothetical protein
MLAMALNGLQFVKDRKYRVRQDFTSRGDTFSSGDVVVFRYQSYSRYDGLAKLGFTKLANGWSVVWTVSDSEHVDISREARELFEEVDVNEAVYAASPPAICSPDKHDWELRGSIRDYEFYVCRICGQEKYRNLKTNTESFVVS